MDRKTPKKHLGIAACAIAVSPSGEIQLFPAGEFRANDGRPKDAPHWFIDSELAAAIISDFESRQNKTVIDYEHQTILTAQNGQPAPAAAWFSKLEWRDSGLYAVDVEWTERASSMIESGEYKYISPVFTYDRKTGAVKSLINAALTNNPALDGMDAVAASQFTQLIDQSQQESLSMELLEQIRWMLNLAVTATGDEVVAELQKAIDQIKSTQPAAAASADFNIVSLIKSQADQIAALNASVDTPDPAKWVAVATMKATQDELTALRTKLVEREVDDVVEMALSSGRLLPAQEDWARKLGMSNLESLNEFVANGQSIAALTRTQTKGTPPGDGQILDETDAHAIAVAARKYQAEQAALGISVSASQAVNFVTTAS